jgi:hypothetical protein
MLVHLPYVRGGARKKTRGWREEGVKRARVCDILVVIFIKLGVKTFLVKSDKFTPYPVSVWHCLV